MRIELTEEQIRLLRDRAKAERRSVADLIRESVERFVSDDQRPDMEELKRRAREALGRFRSGRSDIGVNHDRYLAEDFRR